MIALRVARRRVLARTSLLIARRAARAACRCCGCSRRRSCRRARRALIRRDCFPSMSTFEHYRDLFTRLEPRPLSAQQRVHRVRRDRASRWSSTRWRATRSPSCASAGATGCFAHAVAGLVMPVQVAMLPLFLLMKNARAHQHLLGRDHPGHGEHLRHLPHPPVRARRFPTTCSTPRASTARRELRIYWSIVLPVIVPILATLAIWTFLATWNDFMWPLIVLSDESHYTLPVALANLVGRARAGHRADDGGLGAHRAPGAARVSRSAALLHRRASWPGA